MNGITDVKFCAQKQHCVPAEQITKIRSDDGKTTRQVCLKCYDETMEARKKAKLNVHLPSTI